MNGASGGLAILQDTAASAGTAVRPAAPKASFASRLFGYDIFLSFALGPPPRGTHSYASDLARRLREQDFTVFFSEDEAPPGEQLDSTLRTALLRSKTLVVIANHGTLQDPRWVRKEVEEFRRHHPDRPVITLNVGGALQDSTLAESARKWLGYEGKIWLDESEEAVENGIATEALIDRLATAPKRARSNVKWRWVVRAVGASLIALTIATGIYAWQANRNAHEAERQRKAAVGNLNRALAGEKLAKDNEQQARRETLRAQTAEGDALAQKMRAESEADKARKAEQRVREELRVSTALRLLAEARAHLSGARSEDDERAMLKMLAAHRITPDSQEEGGLLEVLLHDRDLRKLIVTGAPVMTAAFCPDGSCIVSGSDDGSLRLWNARTGHPLGVPFAGAGGAVVSVTFSPDGSRIVSGSGNHSLQLWDAKTRQPIGPPYQLHRGAVRSVAFGPDGRRIVTASDDGSLRFWLVDARYGLMIARELGVIQYPVRSVAFSPDGRQLVSGSDDGKLRIWTNADWDSTNGVRPGEPIAAHAGWVLCVAFSPDGSRIVSGGADNTLRLWDARTGKPVGEGLKGHGGWVQSVAFSPDGSRIVSGSEDHTLRLWDAKTGQPAGAPIAGHKSGLTHVAFSPDGSRILSAGGYDTSLRLWDAHIGQAIGVRLEGHSDAVSAVAFSPDGKRIVSAGEDRSLRLWDGRTGQPLGEPLHGHTAAVTGVAFSPDGEFIVSVGGNNTLRRWNAKTGQPIAAPSGKGSGWAAFVPPAAEHSGWLSSVAVSPDGHRILLGGMDGSLQFRDARTGQPLGLPLEGHMVTSLAFSPDGRRIVSGSDDDSLRLWDTNTGKVIARLQGHKAGVTSVAFSPDGGRIVSGSKDMTLRLWDARSGRTIGPPIVGHTQWVASVAFSPNGRHIVSGGGDNTLRLWDGHSGEAIGPPLRGHNHEVRSVAFSPDGTRIVSASADQTLHLWPAPKVWPDELCRKLTRNMSRKAWRDWVSPEIDYVEQCPGLPIPPDEPDDIQGEAMNKRRIVLR